MPVVRTACTYDCPDACGLLAANRGGQVSVRGDPDHPVTRGFACHRARRHPARLTAPERITRPRIRRGTGWVEIGWDQALDVMTGELSACLDRFGPAAVAYVYTGGSLGLRKELVGHFYRSLGAVTTLGGGVCDECGKEAQRRDFGDCASHDYTDLANSRALVLWGKNPAVTSPHMVPFIRDARSAGTEVVLIEVSPTDSVALADRVIRVAPGGDGFLALAVLRLLHDRGQLDPAATRRTENYDRFERMLTGSGMDAGTLAGRADVSLDDVAYLAATYRDHRPVSTWLGWGMQRRRSGGRTVRCIDALGMLTGQVGVAGGGVNYGPGRRRGLNLGILAGGTGRKIRASGFGRELGELTDPPVRFVHVFGSNPACQFADAGGVGEALRRESFVVVADAFWTDTAEVCDLFLPSTLMLEEGDDAVGSFGHHHVARVRKVVEPPPDAREDVWVVGEVSRRLGRSPDPLLEDPARAVRELTADWFTGAGQSHNRNPAQSPVPYVDSFPTPSGRMRLGEEPPDPVPAVDGYPLVLMTPKRRRFEHSQVPPEFQTQLPLCSVHPHAPGLGGLQDGQVARLVSPLGGIRVALRFDPGMRPDVCQVFEGGWLRFGHGINALVSARETDMGGGTAFYDQRVRIEPCAPSS